MKHATCLALLLAAALSLPASAAVTTINNGNGTTTLRANYIVAAANVTTVRDDICRGIQWPAQIQCTAQMIVDNQCVAGQQVANPLTCINAIDAAIRQYLNAMRKQGAIQAVEDSSVAPVRNSDQTGDILP